MVGSGMPNYYVQGNKRILGCPDGRMLAPQDAPPAPQASSISPSLRNQKRQSGGGWYDAEPAARTLGKADSGGGSAGKERKTFWWQWKRSSGTGSGGERA